MATTSPFKLDLTKPVKTRGGQLVRIVCTDCPGKQPVVGVFEDGMVRQFNTDGSFYLDGRDRSVHDLVNVPVTVRVCFYENIHGQIAAVNIGANTGVSDEDAKRWGKHICIKDIVLDT